jgi:hypothetical protein
MMKALTIWLVAMVYLALAIIVAVENLPEQGLSTAFQGKNGVKIPQLRECGMNDWCCLVATGRIIAEECDGEW